MKRAEPLVQRKEIAGKVDGEIPMVKMVEKVGSFAPVEEPSHRFLLSVAFSEELMESGVSARWINTVPNEHKHNDYGVHRNEKER